MVKICLQWRRPGSNPRVRKIPWRRQRLPTPAFLPGECYGQRSLVGYSQSMGLQSVHGAPKELNTAEWLTVFPVWFKKKSIIIKGGKKGKFKFKTSHQKILLRKATNRKKIVTENITGKGYIKKSYNSVIKRQPV